MQQGGRLWRPSISGSVAWWKEPTKDQWYAWWAAWLGWTLDAFDFTVFLLIMKPIAEEFQRPDDRGRDRLHGDAVDAAGRRDRLGLARRPGRPQDAADDLDLLVLDLQFHRRLFADLLFLFVFRALLGIGMGAEWPAGAALAMEQWPIRSRGFMSGVLQGSWGIGFLLSSVIYGLFFDWIGWRGMLWVGVLPALSVVYVR